MMKFLCIPCDSPMRLQSVGPPERGSLSVVYACPACGYEMAMLTNAFETQIVQSLGVRIGPRPDAAASAGPGARGTSAAESGVAPSRIEAPAQAGSGCPFAAMIPGAEGAAGSPDRAAAQPLPVRWTAAAEARLARVPEFVRPMARTGIEEFARKSGSSEIDERMLDAARDFFGM